MHAETSIVHEEVVLTGSVNLSHNGLANNNEHLLMISVPQTVRQFLNDFKATRAQAAPATEEHPREMQAKQDQADKKKLAWSQSAPLQGAQE